MFRPLIGFHTHQFSAYKELRMPVTGMKSHGIIYQVIEYVGVTTVDHQTSFQRPELYQTFFLEDFLYEMMPTLEWQKM